MAQPGFANARSVRNALENARLRHAHRLAAEPDRQWSKDDLMRLRGLTPGGSGHFRMIFMSGNYKRTKSDIGRIAADLEAKLGQYPGDEDLVNAEDWL